MPYRSDVEARASRRAELERELAEVNPRAEELPYLKWKQKELVSAIAELDGRCALPTNPRGRWARAASAVLAFVGIVTLGIFAAIFATSPVRSTGSGGSYEVDLVGGASFPARNGMEDFTRGPLPREARSPTPHMTHADSPATCRACSNDPIASPR